MYDSSEVISMFCSKEPTSLIPEASAWKVPFNLLSLPNSLPTGLLSFSGLIHFSLVEKKLVTSITRLSPSRAAILNPFMTGSRLLREKAGAIGSLPVRALSFCT